MFFSFDLMIPQIMSFLFSKTLKREYLHGFIKISWSCESREDALVRRIQADLCGFAASARIARTQLLFVRIHPDA
jgi:hypothetical protein